jgi:ADP-ribose pyrophosphatase
MTKDDVEVLTHELLFQGFFRLERFTLRHRLHAGGWSGAIERELFVRGPVAGVLLYDPKLDAVVLIEQFRMGALAAGGRPWLVEIVAGIIDPGESAEETVRREALEEAGVAISDLVPMTTYLTSPGACSEIAYLFCGRVDSSNAGGIHGIGSEQEDIRVVVLSAAEAFARRRKNDEIYDSITINALLWLELEQQALRRRWR